MKPNAMRQAMAIPPMTPPTIAPVLDLEPELDVTGVVDGDPP